MSLMTLYHCIMMMMSPEKARGAPAWRPLVLNAFHSAKTDFTLRSQLQGDAGGTTLGELLAAARSLPPLAAADRNDCHDAVTCILSGLPAGVQKLFKVGQGQRRCTRRVVDVSVSTREVEKDARRCTCPLIEGVLLPSLGMDSTRLPRAASPWPSCRPATCPTGDVPRVCCRQRRSAVLRRPRDGRAHEPEANAAVAGPGWPGGAAGSGGRGAAGAGGTPARAAQPRRAPEQGGHGEGGVRVHDVRGKHRGGGVGPPAARAGQRAVPASQVSRRRRAVGSCVGAACCRPPSTCASLSPPLSATSPQPSSKRVPSPRRAAHAAQARSCSWPPSPRRSTAKSALSLETGRTTGWPRCTTCTPSSGPRLPRRRRRTARGRTRSTSSRITGARAAGGLAQRSASGGT